MAFAVKLTQSIFQAAFVKDKTLVLQEAKTLSNPVLFSHVNKIPRKSFLILTNARNYFIKHNLCETLRERNNTTLR